MCSRDIWTLKVPGADVRKVHLVREAREAVTDANHSQSTDAFQAGSIFTGQHGWPKVVYTYLDTQQQLSESQ